MKKRAISLLLVLVLALSAVTLPAMALGSFSDVSDKATAQNAEVLRLLGVVDGTGGGSFNPGGQLTRAEFCKMTVELIGLGKDQQSYRTMTIFSDVRASHWASGYINLAVRQSDPKLLAGMPDGTFQPDRAITYGEAVTILMRVLGYNDADSGRIWPGGYINLANAKGVGTGLSLSGGAAISRAQAAQLFVNVLNAEKKDGTTYVPANCTREEKETTLVSLSGGTMRVSGSAQNKYDLVRPSSATVLNGLKGHLLTNKDGKAVTFGEFVDLWRITGILTDAVKPAKTETVNGSPVYVHGGPFANVSIGIPTLVSVEMACALHDVVIVEAGYGAYAGAQKWLDIACREYGAQWPSAAIVVTRASTWRDDPALAWRYPFHVQRLEGLDIPTFPLINLWDGEDDQIPALKATAEELEFRAPIIGNLYRDGGDALAPQLDAFVDAVVNGSMPAAPHSHRGMALVEDVRWVAEHAYGVPAERVVLKNGFAESLSEAMNLCASAGMNLGDMALVAVKSPATMTDNDSAPADERTVTLKKVEVHSGAGLVHVNLTASLTTPMPKIV